ncbi:MAG: type II toxin-antitoxin system RelB/DinJ family antitoxin [Pseudomonadota bacterium]
MAASTLVQARIDPVLKDRAAEVLEGMGLTVSDAVRILLTRIAREGALPFELTSNPEAYDIWFRDKVQAALTDPRPTISDEDVKARFAKRRAVAQAKSGAGTD